MFILDIFSLPDEIIRYILEYAQGEYICRYIELASVCRRFAAIMDRWPILAEGLGFYARHILNVTPRLLVVHDPYIVLHDRHSYSNGHIGSADTLMIICQSGMCDLSGVELVGEYDTVIVEIIHYKPDGLDVFISKNIHRTPRILIRSRNKNHLMLPYSTDVIKLDPYDIGPYGCIRAIRNRIAYQSTM